MHNTEPRNGEMRHKRQISPQPFPIADVEGQNQMEQLFEDN